MVRYLPPEMKYDEIIMVCSWWQEYFDLLEGKVDPSLLNQARLFVNPGNFGYGDTMIAPYRETVGLNIFIMLFNGDSPAIEVNPDIFIICRVTRQEYAYFAGLQEMTDEVQPLVVS